MLKKIIPFIKTWGNVAGFVVMIFTAVVAFLLFADTTNVNAQEVKGNKVKIIELDKTQAVIKEGLKTVEKDVKEIKKDIKEIKKQAKEDNDKIMDCLITKCWEK